MLLQLSRFCCLGFFSNAEKNVFHRSTVLNHGAKRLIKRLKHKIFALLDILTRKVGWIY